MPRKVENIYKRKDGRWEGRFIKSRSAQGKAQYGYVYSKTYAGVKKKLLERKTQVTPTKTNAKSPDVSYQDILISWLELQRFSVKESTFAKYYQAVYTHLIPELGSVPVDELSSGLFERYVSQLLEDGRLDKKGGLSPKSANDILVIIISTIEYARNRNIAGSCSLNNLRIKQPKKEMRVLSIEEQKRLTTVLMNDINCVKFGILLSLYTGIRVGEICALKWASIDISLGVLSIKETMRRIKDTSDRSDKNTKIIVSSPKSNCSIRKIPLPPFIAAIAKNLQTSESSYVLTGSSNKIIEPRTMQNHFKALLRECNIHDVNYHALRHTFATRCIEAGFDVKTLSEILGHSNVNITLNRYVHSSFELKIENMKKLSCLMTKTPSNLWSKISESLL